MSTLTIPYVGYYLHSIPSTGFAYPGAVPDTIGSGIRYFPVSTGNGRDSQALQETDRLERLPESLSERDRRSVGGIGDPASFGRDRRSTEITDLGYNCGAFLRFLFGNRSSPTSAVRCAKYSSLGK